MTAEAPAAAAKPDYRIPTMAELAERRGTAGLKFVSTFSGCGGLCLGFEWAGYEPLLAADLAPPADTAYDVNHPGVPVAVGDLRELAAESVLERTGLDVGELDVLEGGPPCQSFSTSGLGVRRWRRELPQQGARQRIDDLFDPFVRLVAGLRPRAFVAENVSGLAKGHSKGRFLAIHRHLEEAGYRVEARLLDAQWLGVPQIRRRVFFVGVRDDLGVAPAFPAPLPYRYGLREAMPGVREILVRSKRSNRPAEIRHPGSGPAPTVMRLGMDDSGHGQVFAVPDAGPPRRITIPELRRLCGFPPDFHLSGGFVREWERLGNAVPPPMAYHVACALRDRVLT